MSKTRKRVIGPNYDDSDKFHNEWNDHRLPQTEFREAIVGIKERLEFTLGSLGAVQTLCKEIKELPPYTLTDINGKSHCPVALTDFFTHYKTMLKNHKTAMQDVNGLIFLLNPRVLPGEQYPQNIEDFAKTFHVQEEDFGYLGPKDTSVAEQVKWIACDVLGVSYELPHDY